MSKASIRRKRNQERRVARYRYRVRHGFAYPLSAYTTGAIGLLEQLELDEKLMAEHAEAITRGEATLPDWQIAAMRKTIVMSPVGQAIKNLTAM